MISKKSAMMGTVSGLAVGPGNACKYQETSPLMDMVRRVEEAEEKGEKIICLGRDMQEAAIKLFQRPIRDPLTEGGNG